MILSILEYDKGYILFRFAISPVFYQEPHEGYKQREHLCICLNVRQE